MLFNVQPLECVVTFLHSRFLSNVVKVARWSNVRSSMYNGRWYSGCNGFNMCQPPCLQVTLSSVQQIQDLGDDLQHCPLNLAASAFPISLKSIVFKCSATLCVNIINSMYLKSMISTLIINMFVLYNQLSPPATIDTKKKDMML